MKYIYLVSLVLILFTGINLEWELFSNRLLRVFTSWAFIMLSSVLIIRKMAAPVPYFALILVAVCDIFLLNWELAFAKPMYYIVHSLASITFLFSIKRQENKPPLSKFDWVYILIITGILTWVMITLGNFFSEEMDDTILQVLFYTNGFLSVILSISAFIFSANSTDDYSSYFLLAIVGLTISDLFLFMIYIMDFMDLRYIDNFLNIFGCALLVNYMIKIQSRKNADKRINEVELEEAVLNPAEKVKVYS